MEVESVGGSSQGGGYIQGHMCEHLTELASLGSQTLYSKYTGSQQEVGSGTSTQARDGIQHSAEHDPQTESEIIVMTGQLGTSGSGTSAGSTGMPSRGTTSTPSELHSLPTATLKPDVLLKRLKAMSGELRDSSFEYSTSVVSDHSELSSPPPTVSSKATTPVEPDSNNTTSTTQTAPPASQQPPPPIPVSRARQVPRRRYDVRPRVSIPSDMAPSDYAMQCIAAAENSRLNPYGLHEEEYQLLRDHISHAQVTTYLNIRNGILRLWMSNPLVMVTREEAIGCAKDSRWFDVANVSYEWLVRRGYINFGCVHFKASWSTQNQKAVPEQTRRRKRVVIIGAGMSGLGCARQLEGLFKQNPRRFRDMGEDVPEVVVLEGRDRVGGRVYSRAFKSKPTNPSPVFEDTRATAEMGGMIITGFERGNPLNVLVRAQLALPYHNLRADTTLYNSTGKAVDPVRDRMVEKLYNDCLDRVSEYKFKQQPSKLIEGKRDLIDEGKDSSSEGGRTIAQVEESAARQPHALPVSQQNIAPRVELVPVSTDRLTGRVHMEPGTPATLKAAYKAQLSGWNLKESVTKEDDIDLESAVAKPDATLGSVVDDVITQFKNIVNLDAQDFRMLNWHIANLEYSNAINYNQLSLQGWDIDAGYEWEGKHSMIIGGYQTVPQGLALFPTPLDIRKKSPVTRIKYSTDKSGLATVECEDGSRIEADYVVSTIPLGVLKHGSVQFEPPLPPRKAGAIERLGYGVLNKVILVYKEAFWDEDRDIFGVLRFPPTAGRHSVNQQDYTRNRGRFFQWFNVSNTSGVPCLLALMAGDAGFETEHTCNDDLVSEATRVLRSVFGSHVPEPEETVITRWASDKFARGSYSSAGPNMQQHDYDIMREPVGNLFFAGEHTIGTHPATVHGAYMSGLRAASEVMTSILGPIDVPVPLVLPRDIASLKRKATDPSITKAQVYTEEMDHHIIAQIGLPPEKPKHQSTSPFIYYSREPSVVEEARRRCDIGRRPGKGKSSWNDIRNEMAKMWKDADAETRKPFEAEAGKAKLANVEGDKAWADKLKEWNIKYAELEAKYRADNPFVPDPVEEVAAAGRRTKAQVRSYAEPDSDEDVEMDDE